MTNVASTEVSIPLDLTDVQQSLRTLWASEELRNLSVVRARTHNLIISAAHAEAEQILIQIIDLAVNYPGRIIFISVDEGTPELTGTVSAYCRRDGNKEVCGELITLHARGSVLENAHSAISSLLIPDLPVYLWWNDAPSSDGGGGPLSGNHLFEEIAPQSDRIIFDSDTFAEPISGLKTLAQLEGFTVGDLNWNRTIGWRQMMAQLYDVPDVAHQMRNMRSLDVHYIANQQPHNPNRALLMVGWMAHRLDWTLQDAKIGKTGGYIFKFDAKQVEQQIKVEVVEGHASNLDEGEVTGIFLMVGSSAPYVMPRLVLSDHRDCLEMHLIESETADPSHIIAYADKTYAQLLAEELNYGYDADYSQALAWAGKLLSELT